MLADSCNNILKDVSAIKFLMPNMLDARCHCIVLYILIELISLATKPQNTNNYVFWKVWDLKVWEK